MKWIAALISIYFYAFNCRSQADLATEVKASTVMNQFWDDNGITAFEPMRGIPLPAGKLLGSQYLEEDWQVGTLSLNYKQVPIVGLKLKYDCYQNLIEILYKNQIKLINASKVYEIKLQNGKRYIFSGNYEGLKDNPDYLMEILTDDYPIKLLKLVQIELKRANYNIALDVGSRDSEFIRREKYFYLINEQIKELSKLKGLVKEFNDVRIRSYIQGKNVSLNSENSIIELFRFINNLE